MKIDMEFQNEKRDQATIKMSKYQQAVKQYHDARVFPRYFQDGDQVLRMREANKPFESRKFVKTWE